MIGVLGAGVMGETIFSGLLKAGWNLADIVVTDRRDHRQRELTEKYGVRVVTNAEAAELADTLLIVVKPQDVPELLTEIAPVIKPGTLVVSLCAGITTQLLEDALPAGTPVVRVMPNTPALVSEGMAALSAGSHTSPANMETAIGLLQAVGKTVVVPERYQDAVTALSGTGPAYLFYVVEAMIDGGVLLGLPRDIATELAVQTMLGSAKLLRETGEHPTKLREQVTSPGGTTAAAVRELENHRVRAAFVTAIEAARNRSREMARGSK